MQQVRVYGGGQAMQSGEFAGVRRLFHGDLCVVEDPDTEERLNRSAPAKVWSH